MPEAVEYQLKRLPDLRAPLGETGFTFRAFATTDPETIALVAQGMDAPYAVNTRAKLLADLQRFSNWRKYPILGESYHVQISVPRVVGRKGSDTLYVSRAPGLPLERGVASRGDRMNQVQENIDLLRNFSPQLKIAGVMHYLNWLDRVLPWHPMPDHKSDSVFLNIKKIGLNPALEITIVDPGDAPFTDSPGGKAANWDDIRMSKGRREGLLDVLADIMTRGMDRNPDIADRVPIPDVFRSIVHMEKFSSPEKAADVLQSALEKTDSTSFQVMKVGQYDAIIYWWRLLTGMKSEKGF